MPIDQDKRLDREKRHKIKSPGGVNAGPKDWVGISPDGRIWRKGCGQRSVYRLSRLTNGITVNSGFTFDIALRITHPSVDPREIDKKLSLVPHFSYKVGEKRRTPKGNPLAGNFKHSFWFYRLPKKHNASLPEVLREMNRSLKKSKAYLTALQRGGGRLEYFIGWFSDANSGESVDWQVLKECADLRINLAFDIYGPEHAPLNGVS